MLGGELMAELWNCIVGGLRLSRLGIWSHSIGSPYRACWPRRIGYLAVFGIMVYMVFIVPSAERKNLRLSHYRETIPISGVGSIANRQGDAVNGCCG